MKRLANISRKVCPDISNPFHRKPFLTQADFLRNFVTLQMPELSSMTRKVLVATYLLINFKYYVFLKYVKKLLDFIKYYVRTS